MTKLEVLHGEEPEDLLEQNPEFALTEIGPGGAFTLIFN